MPLHDLVRATLNNLPRTPLLDRAVVVDTLLDMLSATPIPEERTQLMETLSRVPRSVVVDRTAVADLLLDLLGPGEPSPN
ncbi:MAG: hypothetical protein M3357_00550 [Actinomycetota bacterium]|nr:hypothetical protein [Actinomycetota bacterium]